MSCAEVICSDVTKLVKIRIRRIRNLTFRICIMRMHIEEFNCQNVLAGLQCTSSVFVRYC